MSSAQAFQIGVYSLSPSLILVEPRKNQTLLLDVCEELWGEGLKFELRVLGRVNAHFGAPIAARLKTLAKKYPQLRHVEAAGDAELAACYAAARATVRIVPSTGRATAW